MGSLALTALLLLLTTLLYAGYNLLIRHSAGFAGGTGVPTITAIAALQVAALGVSLSYWLGLYVAGERNFLLPGTAYGWALIAGGCIGLAELCYFWLYTGIAGSVPLSASVATPVIVAGTIILTLVCGALVWSEPLNGLQWCGVAVTTFGVILLFFGAQ